MAVKLESRLTETIDPIRGGPVTEERRFADLKQTITYLDGTREDSVIVERDISEFSKFLFDDQRIGLSMLTSPRCRMAAMLWCLVSIIEDFDPLEGDLITLIDPAYLNEDQIVDLSRTVVVQTGLVGSEFGVFELLGDPAQAGETGFEVLARFAMRLNAPPAFLGDFDLVVSKNTNAVGTVLASDPDNDPLTFSITGGMDAGLFRIDPVLGALSLVNPQDFENPGDENRDGILQLELTITDAVYAPVTQLFSVTISDANDAPVFVTPSEYSLRERDTEVGLVRATDADEAALSHSLMSGLDSGLFAIDATTGSLSFRSAPDFERPLDANGDNHYEVRVAASDGTISSTQILDVSVTDFSEIIDTRRPDRLVGTDGDDYMDGGRGSNKYFGCTGADIFVAGERGRDKILDFEVGSDRIDLSNWGTQSLDELKIFALKNKLIIFDAPIGNRIEVWPASGTLDATELTEDSFVFAPIEDLVLRG